MAAPVEAGDLLADKYRVERVLGEGGMGVVVAATDLQLERQVAIKFLLPQAISSNEAVERFLREARAAVKIQSEHVARVIDVGSLDSGAPYLVMEYLEGADLASILAKHGPLPYEDAVDYVLQACEAIAEAHAHGIVHRDLKPANLFLAQQADGTAKIKVLDFGISKLPVAGTKSGLSLTRTSSLMGSPLYMSPEQMKSSREVDSRTDIWGLGVILYELIAGVPPFDGDSIPELSAKVLLNEPESLQARRPDVPPELERAITTALAKNREDRFPTVSELSLALMEFAPRRTRATVERITRVMQVAGLSKSGVNLPTSWPAPVRGRGDSTARAKGVKTESNWGKTGESPATRRRARAVWLVVALLAVLGGLGWLGGRTLGSSAPHATVGAVGPTSAEAVNGPAPAPRSQESLGSSGVLAGSSAAPNVVPAAAPEPSSVEPHAKPQAASRAARTPPAPTHPAGPVTMAVAGSAPAPDLPVPSIPTAKPAPAVHPTDPWVEFGARR